MKILPRLSDLTEISDLDPVSQRRVWRRAVRMALRHPLLPTLTVGFIAFMVTAAHQTARLERYLFLSLFSILTLLVAVTFNHAILRVVRPYLKDAREQEPRKGTNP